MIINYLKKDITSNNKKTIYGYKGDRIIIISNHHPAMIVRSFETGNTFSVNVENISEIKIEKDVKTKNEMRSGKVK